VALATAVPFVSTFAPSERAKAAGAAGAGRHQCPAAGREDDGRMARQAGVDRAPHAGAARRAEEDSTRSWPIPNSERKAYPTPEYAKNGTARSSPSAGGRRHLLAPGLLAVGQVRSVGAQPSLPDDWQGGFLCPCHGSTFDMAGRVFKNKPAPDNLEVPPHMYLSDTRLLIGEDKKA
jgi:ubiquinol-cytochrome c reductase iron-sulfur subunit